MRGSVHHRFVHSRKRGSNDARFEHFAAPNRGHAIKPCDRTTIVGGQTALLDRMQALQAQKVSRIAVVFDITAGSTRCTCPRFERGDRRPQSVAASWYNCLGRVWKCAVTLGVPSVAAIGGWVSGPGVAGSERRKHILTQSGSWSFDPDGALSVVLHLRVMVHKLWGGSMAYEVVYFDVIFGSGRAASANDTKHTLCKV